jgi:hypothetical protein
MRGIIRDAERPDPMSENAVVGNQSLSHESSSLIGKKPPINVWQGVL